MEKLLFQAFAYLTPLEDTQQHLFKVLPRFSVNTKFLTRNYYL